MILVCRYNAVDLFHISKNVEICNVLDLSFLCVSFIFGSLESLLMIYVEQHGFMQKIWVCSLDKLIFMFWVSIHWGNISPHVTCKL